MGSSGRALVAQANVIARGRDGRGGLPLRDGVADLVVCSPPYLWKRKYAISGTGEMGNEANWRLFLDNLWAATDEMLRVLKVGGSIFVNLGDTRVSGREPRWLGIPPKSKLLLPERYRVGCQDRYAAQGVIVRQVNIWEHVNGLPESVTDRTRDSHEDIIHIVKPDRAGRYYSAVDEVRDTAASHYHDRPQYQRAMQIFREAGFTDAHMAAVRAVGVIDSAAGQVRSGGSWESESGRLAWQVREKLGSYYRELCGSNTAPLGKLPGSVWAIPSEPLRLPDWLGVQHYAAFPSELPRRIILGWSPPGICVACGEGRWPVVDRQYSVAVQQNSGSAEKHRWLGGGMHNHGVERGEQGSATILGYACKCCPFTDHPGTGEVTVGHHDLGRMDGYPNVGQGWEPSPASKGGLGDRPKVGPWREYHLDRWTPPPTRPAVVLDPFGGVGTTALVARALGRDAYSFDLSGPYSRAADWRIHHSGHHGKAITRTWTERQGTLL